MGDLFYKTFREFGRFVKRQCIADIMFDAHHVQRDGGFLLAPTHVSHVEPLLLSAAIDRPIDWMARIEFYRVPILGQVLRLSNTFEVHRQGRPVKAVRTAIDLARRGRVVGVFPEGGCRKGKSLAIRGGAIRQGVCTIALHAQVPIVPVVMIGTHTLNGIDPWLPGIRGKVWTIYGEPIFPVKLPARKNRREIRRALGRELEAAYVRIYRDLLDRAELKDSFTP